MGPPQRPAAGIVGSAKVQSSSQGRVNDMDDTCLGIPGLDGIPLLTMFGQIDIGDHYDLSASEAEA
jgi:hypothetical protein